jgi:hypothetical protein
MILKKEHSSSLKLLGFSLKHCPTGKIKIVEVIGIWDLRFVWNLMLEIWNLFGIW